MTEKLKATLPLALTVGILAALWIEFSMNFTFHWVTDGDLPNALGMPKDFHLVVTAGFVSWAFFFAAGGTMAALQKVTIASVAGALVALLTMWLAPEIADLPDFWAITLVVAVAAFGGVLLTVTGDWWYLPGVFGAFAITITWWLATGADNWLDGGGGKGGLASLAKPATAGTGAFGGVLSTPYFWVFMSTLVSLLAGCILAAITGAVTGSLRATAAERE